MMIILNSLGSARSDQYYYLISISYLKVFKKDMCEILRVFPHQDVDFTSGVKLSFQFLWQTFNQPDSVGVWEIVQVCPYGKRKLDRFPWSRVNDTLSARNTEAAPECFGTTVWCRSIFQLNCLISAQVRPHTSELIHVLNRCSERLSGTFLRNLGCKADFK